MPLVGHDQMIVDGEPQGTGGGHHLPGQSLVPLGRFQASSRMVMHEDQTAGRFQFESFLENLPWVDCGVVHSSLLHQDAVQDVVPVVQKHTKESLVGFPSDELLEV